MNPQQRQLYRRAVVAAAKEMGSPTTGSFAFALWELLSSQTMTVAETRDLYDDCGYEPFRGYPLTRKEVKTEPVRTVRT